MARLSRFWLGRWVGVAVSIVMLAWLAHAFDFSETLHSLKIADYSYFVPVPLLVVFVFVIRSLRWKVLFLEAEPKSRNNLFSSMMIG